MRGRMYDPLAGRFMSVDPVMQAPFSTQGLNPYKSKILYVPYTK